MSTLLVLALLLQSGGARQVDITVHDTQGLAIRGARITVTEQQGSGRKTALTTEDRSRIDGLAAAVYEVRVEANGFATQTVLADLRNQTVASLDVSLEVARVTQEVIVAVTRTEQQIGDLPASATVLRADEIRQSPAVVADDVLRQVPEFSLFRRTSSLAAHPTAQGVSLRGVGPSGVSRTLVLIDNVPFNDPFGGWVYWTRVPLANVERVEIVDGANSSVYGNYALGGVINIVTTPPEGRTFSVRSTIAGRATHKVDFFGANAWEKFAIAAEGSVFDTNGYFTVPETEGGNPLRGPVDTRATVDYENFNLKMDFSPTDRITAFIRGGYFSEDRVNGKVGEFNDTIWKSVNGGVRIRMSDSDLQFRAWGNLENFHSNFLAISSVAQSRDTSRVSLLQGVPTNDAGGMVQWSKALGARNYFTIGSDVRWVDGDSREDVIPAGTAVTTYRISGGTQRSVGVFMQDLISVTPRFQLTLSARLDHWKNYDAHNLETSATTGANGAGNRPSCKTNSLVPCLADKMNTVGNPRVGALYHISDAVSVWGSASWGFRAPTLNELYRQFRVGQTLTLPNEQLGPERLTSGEGGVNVSPLRNLTWRSTWFVNKFTNPISNITTNVVPGTTTRQRQNLGKARIWGLQSDVEYRLPSYWRFSLAYLYDVAKVKESRVDFTGTSLVGKFLPEVPMHRGSVEVAYANPKFVIASASAQFVGGQYDDDLNTLWLPYYSTVDINVSRKISQNLEFFFGVQNLFDRTFYVQRVPTTNGAPRFVSGGLQITWNGK